MTARQRCINCGGLFRWHELVEIDLGEPRCEWCRTVDYVAPHALRDPTIALDADRALLAQRIVH